MSSLGVFLFNLFLALFWLLLGLGLLFIPGFERWQIGDTGVKFAWVPIGLAVYNLLRWLLWRSQQRGRRTLGVEPSRPAPREYHPEFDFSDEQRPHPKP
jgi:hypothetical protein